MILYYDIYIDDMPLEPRNVKANQEIRLKCSQYKMPKKVDIARYTLASYAVIPWSHVIIKFDVANEEDADLFLEYAREIFPNADISRPCSSNQITYKETVEKICTMGDDFIFYAPNNDHPFMTGDLHYLYKALDKALKFKREYKFVSIVYSHFSEFINAPIIGSPFYIQYASDSRIVEDDDIATSFVRINGDNSSCQIVHKDLLRYWFCSHDLGNERIIRAEDVRKFFLTPNQLMIVPKKELCAHFDGYSHTSGITLITPDQVPPLFIPPGFFDRSIRIAYGYSDYREGWVNINPAAKGFCFRDQDSGTDLKIGLQDIPLFWKKRIKEVDVNPNADFEKIEKGRAKYYQTVRNPWGKTNLSLVQKIKKGQLMTSIKSRIIASASRIFNKRLTSTIVSDRTSNAKDFARLAAIGLTLDPKKPLKLHFGSGPRVLKEWVNIDLKYEHFADYLQYYTDKFFPLEIRGTSLDFIAFDVTQRPLPLPDNSVDVVFHEDFIEHLSQKNQILFLAETCRVLKPGAIHRINTPNLLVSMRNHADFSRGYDGVYADEWDKHVHLNILTPEVLEEMALMVGYSKVIFTARNQSASELLPLEYRPDPHDRPENGNIFADLIK